MRHTIVPSVPISEAAIVATCIRSHQYFMMAVNADKDIGITSHFSSLRFLVCSTCGIRQTATHVPYTRDTIREIFRWLRASTCSAEHIYFFRVFFFYFLLVYFRLNHSIYSRSVSSVQNPPESFRSISIMSRHIEAVAELCGILCFTNKLTSFGDAERERKNHSHQFLMSFVLFLRGEWRTHTFISDSNCFSDAQAHTFVSPISSTRI